MKITDFSIGLSLRQKLFLLVCLAFSLRLYVVLNAAAVAVDSTVDIGLARAFSEGDFLGGIDKARPPLHPLLVSLFYQVFQDYELAARVVSLVFGTLVIPLSFYLGRLVYNERAGLLTAFFVTVHPYLIRYSGDTLREALYHFFAVTLTILGLKIISNRSKGLMLLAGIVSLLAYLTKHVSIGFFIVISLWVVFYDFRRIREDWRERLGLLASGWAPFIILAVPYLVFLLQETGGATITGKIDMEWLLSRVHKTISFNNDNLYDFTRRLPQALSFLFFAVFLFLYPLKVRREGVSTPEYFLLAVLLAYSLLHLITLPERRYLIRLAPMALVFAAIGFCQLEQWLKARAGGGGGLLPGMIIAVLLLEFAAVQLPRGLVSLHAHRLTEKTAGLWFKEFTGGGAAVVSQRPIFTFYADGKHVKLRGRKLERVLRRGMKRGAEYLVGYPSRLAERIPDFDESNEKFLVEVNSFAGDKGKFVIYEFSVEDHRK